MLDIGCGSGNTACLIATQYGSHVVGIDISEVMISKARERAIKEGVADKVEFRIYIIFLKTFLRKIKELPREPVS